jgi:hypothetical protein
MTFSIQMFDDFVAVFNTAARGHVQVRGKPNYATDWDASDPLHQFLDSLDPMVVSMLFANGHATVNPNNQRSTPSVVACGKLFQDNP